MLTMTDCGSPQTRADELEGLEVGEVATSRLKTLASSARVADVRGLFGNSHVRTALLVDGDGIFAGSIDREALPPGAGDDEPAAGYATRERGVVGQGMSALDALALMQRDGLNRLVVVEPETRVLRGLVCLTATGDSLCR